MNNLARDMMEVEPVKPTLQKVRFTHDAIIDEILINPSVSQNELSRMFGFKSPAWMSIVVNSDAFKERLAERKAELIDPAIRSSIQERLDAVARGSLDRIMARLDSPNPIKDADLVAMAKLGVGDKNNRLAAPTQQNNLYVIQAPLPAKDSAAWLSGASSVTTRPPAPLEVLQEVPRG